MEMITMFVSTYNGYNNETLERVTDLTPTHYICGATLYPIDDVLVIDVLTPRELGKRYLYERVNLCY